MSIFYLSPRRRMSRLARAALGATGFRVARVGKAADPEAILEEIVARGRPVLICERYSPGTTVGLELSRLLSVPFVLEVHRAVGSDPVEQRLFRDSDLVLAATEGLREAVARVRGSDAGTAAPDDAAARIAELTHP